MPLTFSNLYTVLATPENNGTQIGMFRICCALFGGLLVAYSAMTLVVLLIPAPVGHAMIVPFLFTPFAWSCAALWISVAPSKLSALIRCLVPSLIFGAGVLISI
jgi:hypothetical protein